MKKHLKLLLLAGLAVAGLAFTGCHTTVSVGGPGYYNISRCYWTRIDDPYGFYEDMHCWNPYYGRFYPYYRDGIIVRRYPGAYRGRRGRFARPPRQVVIVRRPGGRVGRGGGTRRGGGSVGRGGGTRRGGGSVGRGGGTRRGGGSVGRGGGSRRGGGRSSGGTRRGGGRRGGRVLQQNLFAADLELPRNQVQSVDMGGSAFENADLNYITSDSDKAVLKAVIHAESQEKAQELVDRIASQNRNFDGHLNLQDRDGFECQYEENEAGERTVVSGACVSFAEVSMPRLGDLDLAVDGVSMDLELSSDASDGLAGSIESDF